MSTMAAVMPSKKRAAPEAPATVCPYSKKTAKEVTMSASGTLAGVPGWQYPPLPMGMIPPMPYCMPGNPFFPFMGMFPPFWLPAAAMAAATMPALAAASAANPNIAVAVPCVTGMVAQPAAAAAMWPMMQCAAAVQPIQAAVAAAAPMPALARASSGVSSAAAFPSTSCTNSVPTVGAVQSSSPSPVSVCNGDTQQPPEDDDFADFIGSILLDGDQDLLLRCGGADVGEQAASELALQVGDLISSGGSNCSEGTTDEDACLTRSDSHSFLSLLGPDDIGLGGL